MFICTSRCSRGTLLCICLRDICNLTAIAVDGWNTVLHCLLNRRNIGHWKSLNLGQVVRISASRLSAAMHGLLLSTTAISVVTRIECCLLKTGREARRHISLGLGNFCCETIEVLGFAELCWTRVEVVRGLGLVGIGRGEAASAVTYGGHEGPRYETKRGNDCSRSGTCC